MKALAVLAVAALAALTLWTNSGTASAQTPAPEVFQNSAECFRSIVQADDLFCLNRYQLPNSSTTTPVAPEEWCAYLIDLTGCTGNPVDPDQPYSLQAGAAFITLYDGTTLLGQGSVPRIGHALGGLYLPAGHGITWATTTVSACVESSQTLFTVPSSSCLPVIWNTAANTATAQRSALGAGLVNQLAALEVVDPLIALNGYVFNNKITDSGRTLALETLNVMDRLVSSFFSSGTTPLVTDGYTPGPGLQLQADIDATAAAFKSDLANAGTSLGIPGDALGLLLFTSLGIVAFVLVKRFGGDSNVLAVVAFLTMMLCGTLVGAVPIAVAAITALLIFMIAAMFVLRKMVVAQ